MESMNPETRARTSTVATAANRPVYSSHSVIVFWSGLATVTDGGGGDELAAGLLSQPTSVWAASSRMPGTIPRVMVFPREFLGCERKGTWSLISQPTTCAPRRQLLNQLRDDTGLQP